MNLDLFGVETPAPVAAPDELKASPFSPANWNPPPEPKPGRPRPPKFATWQEEVRAYLDGHGPRVYPDFDATKPAFDTFAVVRRRLLEGPSTHLPVSAAADTTEAALRDLMAVCARSRYGEQAPASPVDSFPDARTARAVYAAKLESRARPLVHTQTEFHQDGKRKGLRYLRAIVRKHNYALLPARAQGRKCGRVRHSKTGVAVFVRPGAGEHGNDVVSLAGLVRCGSVWSCPSCAPRVGAVRSELLSGIVKRHRATGGDVLMLTLTLAHHVGMSCSQLRKAKAAAWKLFQQGKGWRDLKTKMGFVGSVSATEITHGANGWHPHLHVLLCVRRQLSPAERAEFEGVLFDRWRSAVERQDILRMPPPLREYGAKLTVCTDDSYVTKLGLSDELTRSVYKGGRDGNRTAWQIMADYAGGHDDDDAKILRAYHKGMKGARALTWSRGAAGAEDLRKVYAVDGDPLQLALLDGEDDNAAALEAGDKDGVRVADLPPQQWDALTRICSALGSDAEAELINAVEEHGGEVGVRTVIETAYRRGRDALQERPKLAPWLLLLAPADTSNVPTIVDAPPVRPYGAIVYVLKAKAVPVGHSLN